LIDTAARNLTPVTAGGESGDVDFEKITAGFVRLIQNPASVG